jgi:hypothetical protein
MKKLHASMESGKPTKRESTDEHQVTREDMGARREQRKQHHGSRKPCRKAKKIQFFFKEISDLIVLEQQGTRTLVLEQQGREDPADLDRTGSRAPKSEH